MKILELINMGSNLLREKSIPSHILTRNFTLQNIKKNLEEILINLDEKINKQKILEFKNYLSRRLKKEPIAYILDEKEFFSKKFLVNNTLIPRPETELLVEKLLKIYDGKKISILDIGTGSGCILLSLLDGLRKSNGVGIDISKRAILTAKKNSNRYKLNNRARFLTKSFESIFYKKFDLIVSNPPYIDKKDINNLSEEVKIYEPRIALDGGNDGLDLIKKVIYKSKNILKIKGTLALEIGNEQIKKVSKILFDNNFRLKYVIRDYRTNIRCIIANYN